MTRRLEMLGFSYSALLVLTLSLSTLSSTQVSAVAEQEAPLRCLVGWGSDQMKDIPADWMNDGYCDCPFDGADELNTDACSGIESWPGSSIAIAADGNVDPDQQEVTYVSTLFYLL
jgi:hypothetical protein